MLDQRGLYLHGADAVSGDIQHVVHATEYPEIFVVVALCSVTREIEIGAARPFREISLDVPVVVPPDRAQHGRPRLREGEQTAADVNARGSRVQQIGRVTR